MLLVNSLKKTPVVLNKCGGHNPLRHNWQYAQDMILFSKENYDFFKSIDNLNPGMHLHLIPSRVKPVSDKNIHKHP